MTVNAGSTSLKLEGYQLVGALPAVGEPPEPFARYDSLDAALAERFDAVSHRVVRVPDEWGGVTLLDRSAQARVAGVGADAPLHDAPALRVVDAVREARADLPQYAVADGAFHRTLSPAAYTYGLPRELSQGGLRRRGFHGLSHEYAAHRAARMAGGVVAGTRIVSLHLGGGSSLCAVRDGASVDTTMGYTPLDGVPMATRSGSVDPGLLIHLLRGGMTVDALEEMLERRSGLLGMSALSGDVRELLAARDDPDAQLALDVFVWRTRAALGGMIAVLGGVDIIAFTGGIGEHAALLRTQILEGSAAWGTVPVCVVPARENWMLARAVAAALR